MRAKKKKLISKSVSSHFKLIEEQIITDPLVSDGGATGATPSFVIQLDWGHVKTMPALQSQYKCSNLKMFYIIIFLYIIILYFLTKESKVSAF